MISWVWPARRDSASSSRMRARARRCLDRQIADEGEALAVQAAGRQRQQQRDSGPAAARPRCRSVVRGARPARRPGSATAGMPASLSRPMSWPSSAGASSACSAAGERSARAAPFLRLAAARRCAAPAAAAPAARSHRRASGTRASILAFSPPSARAGRRRAIAPSGSTSRRSAGCVAVPKSSGVGTRKSAPRVPVIARADRCRRARSMLAGADQRQADQRGRIVRLDRLEQRDAEVFALGAAGAVVGLLGAQVALDLGVVEGAKAHRHRRQRLGCSKPVARRTTATAVWKTTLRPLMRRSCATARSWLPGLPIGSPSRSATWSEPITTASACAPPPRAPWPARAAAPARRALRRRAAFRRRRGALDVEAAGAGAAAVRGGSARSSRG